jgi:hypothetical protein
VKNIAFGHPEKGDLEVTGSITAGSERLELSLNHIAKSKTFPEATQQTPLWSKTPEKERKLSNYVIRILEHAKFFWSRKLVLFIRAGA